MKCLNISFLQNIADVDYSQEILRLLDARLLQRQIISLARSATLAQEHTTKARSPNFIRSSAALLYSGVSFPLPRLHHRRL
jgi:hypothetical protein